MPDTAPNSDSPPPAEKQPLITFLLGAVVLAAIVVSAWFLFHEPAPRDSQAGKATIVIAMNSNEQQYIPNIHLKDISLSRAENFIHQEVTILDGSVVNSGSQSVSAMQLTIQFSDELGQTALRETRVILGPSAGPLPPGQERKFEVSFDHVPASWNRQQPTFQIASLSLQPK